MEFNKDRISPSIWMKWDVLLLWYVSHRKEHGLHENGVYALSFTSAGKAEFGPYAQGLS